MAKSNVVIVGGGGYGAQIARVLSSKLDPNKHTLTLVSSREFFLHLPAGPRLMTSSRDDLEKTALMPYDSLFTGMGVFRKGTVTGVKKADDGKSGTVVLASGEELSWNVLLLAPGNTWEGGLRLPETRLEVGIFINEWRKKFERAKSIALIGGGAVGIELSGELRDIYPDKKITLVHADKHLVNDTYPDKFRKDIEKRLRARNITLLLNTRVEGESLPSEGLEGSVRTTDGKTIEADLIVPTRGGRPATAFLSTLSPNPLTSTGHVKVKRTLQLAEESNILAVGDVTDIKEQKQVGKALGYIDLVVGNILGVLNGGKLKEYKGSMEAIFITIGRGGGAGYMDALWGLSFGNWAVSTVKSKGLFVGMTRKSLGLSS